MLTRIKVPRTLGAVITLLVGVVVFFGLISLASSQIINGLSDLWNQASVGLSQAMTWLWDGPLQLDQSKVMTYWNQLQSEWGQVARQYSSTLATGALSVTNSIGTIVTQMLIVLFCVFFFLKDGPSFLPWMRRLVGRKAGMHLTEVLTRSWNTLSGFIKAQAIVSLVDAVCIGIGLVALGVPLAWALAVITFLGGFIPIIGGFTAGTLGVMVALVANGPMNAIIVLVLIVAVMQLEGHILQPFLQSKAMNLHPVVVLLAVAAGGTLYGIIGAFLAVPFAAVAAVLLRYLGEQIDLRTGEVMASDLTTYTDEGKLTAWLAELSSSRFAPVRRGSTALLGGLVDGRGEGAETADEDDDEPAAAAPRSDRTTDETQSDGNAPARRRRARGFRRRRRDR